MRISKKGVRSGGHLFIRGSLYRILQNQVYLEKIVHIGTAYPGHHQPIIYQPLWDQVMATLLANRAATKLGARTKDSSLLFGLLFDERGNALSPAHAVKDGKRHRYYVNQALIQYRPEDAGAVRRVAAHDVEQLLCSKQQSLFYGPALVADMPAIPPERNEALQAL